MKQPVFNTSYVGQRPDVERLVPSNARAVLDVGCSTGVLGAAIKARTGAQVYGIELSEAMAAEARTRIDRVFVGDVAEILLHGALSAYEFDTIVFADVLEHLVDPWGVLRAATRRLRTKGAVIASIPNIRHWDTVCNLVLKGYWPYRDRGIHDRTHLRFFTRRNIVELFQSAGLSVETLRTNYRLWERPHRLNQFARYLALPGIRSFLAFQYLVRARPTNRQD